LPEGGEQAEERRENRRIEKVALIPDPDPAIDPIAVVVGAEDEITRLLREMGAGGKFVRSRPFELCSGRGSAMADFARSVRLLLRRGPVPWKNAGVGEIDRKEIPPREELEKEIGNTNEKTFRGRHRREYNVHEKGDVEKRCQENKPIWEASDMAMGATETPRPFSCAVARAEDRPHCGVGGHGLHNGEWLQFEKQIPCITHRRIYRRARYRFVIRLNIIE
jgi:hypothetical protein